MKVNVDIDQEKIEKIRNLNKNLRFKREIVDLALSELINSLSRQKLVDLRGKVEWAGNLNEIKTHDVRSFE